MAIESQLLKTERDRLKESLREIEAELRRLESDLKSCRQREIQIKRELEALGTLIDISDSREARGDGS